MLVKSHCDEHVAGLMRLRAKCRESCPRKQGHGVEGYILRAMINIEGWNEQWFRRDMEAQVLPSAWNVLLLWSCNSGSSSLRSFLKPHALQTLVINCDPGWGICSTTPFPFLGKFLIKSEPANAANRFTRTLHFLPKVLTSKIELVHLSTSTTQRLPTCNFRYLDNQ